MLKSEAIEPIACLGLLVDPERMIVIETTESTEWPPQTVTDELRRGYTWRGRVLRLAEVRAVRGRRDEAYEESDEEVNPSLSESSDHEAWAENGSQSAWLETE